MIVIFSVLPIILPCLTLFSTSVSSETDGKGNSLSSGVDLAYYLHGIVLPHAGKFRVIAALLDLGVQRRCGRCKGEDIAQIPAQQQDQLLGILAAAGLHHGIDTFQAIEHKVGPDLQLKGGHLVAAGFQLLFVTVDLQLGDLVDHPVEGLVHLRKLSVAIIHTGAHRKFTTADPVHVLTNAVIGAKISCFI